MNMEREMHSRYGSFHTRSTTFVNIHEYSKQCKERCDLFIPVLFDAEANELAKTRFKSLSETLNAPKALSVL